MFRKLHENSHSGGMILASNDRNTRKPRLTLRVPSLERLTCIRPLSSSTWSQLNATSSETRRPWRYVTRISVESRCPCLPTFDAAFFNRSTSLSVRYSWGRTSAFFGFEGSNFPENDVWRCLDEVLIFRGNRHLPELTFPIMDGFGKVRICVGR